MRGRERKFPICKMGFSPREFKNPISCCVAPRETASVKAGCAEEEDSPDVRPNCQEEQAGRAAEPGSCKPTGGVRFREVGSMG